VKWKKPASGADPTFFAMNWQKEPSMNHVESEARSSPGEKLALTPALSPRRGRITLRQFEMANAGMGSWVQSAKKFLK
jgi:hypothetical protein